MLKNYLKIAWRNLLKNKGYSLITTIGLSVAVACCIIVSLYVYHELSYEAQHVKADRIYRVGQYMEVQNNRISTTATAGLLGPAAVEQLPNVHSSVHLTQNPSTLISNGEISAFEDEVYFTNSRVFDLFTVPLLKGDKSTALESPGTAVISVSLAKKYFGDVDPIGKRLTITEEEIPLTISGLFSDPPSNTNLTFHLIANPAARELEWDLFSGVTNYLLLDPQADPQLVEEQLLELSRSNSDNPYLKSFILDRLDQIHLYGTVSSTGDIRYIYIFSIVALFLLLVAIINYINLSIAQLIPRSREVGIRKTLGARWSQLSLQYFSEAILLSLIALFAGILLVEVVYPVVDTLPGVSLAAFSLRDGWLWAVLIPLAFVIALISGSYITFHLARINPAALFQKQVGSSLSGSNILRKGLITFQFAVSILLICCTLIVQKQLRHISEARLGFDKEHMVTVDLPEDLRDRYRVLKDHITSLQGVEAVSASSMTIGVGGIPGFILPENAPIPHINVLTVEENFFNVMGMEVKSGNLMNLQEGDRILNASAAEAFGVTEPDGRSFQQIVNGDDTDDLQGEVVAVIKDFHFSSLRAEIAPMVIRIGSDSMRMLNIRLRPGSVVEAMDRINAAWDEFAPGIPITYTFLDDQIDSMYRSDQRFARIFWGFSLMTIVIACMGLFGLAALAAESRTREIGIRKVLGATVSSIVGLLGSEFLKLVAVGFGIAVPLAWYIMNQWLTDFEYRIEIGPGIFLLAGTAALLIALVTVSWQSVKAALENPVDSLRSE